MTDSNGTRRGALTTLVTLVGGLSVAIGTGGLVSGVLEPASLALARVLAGVVALGLTSMAAGRWMQQMARLAGAELSRHSSVRAGLFVSVPVIAVGASLAAIEPIAVQRGATLGLSIHAVFTVLFVLATLLVSAFGSYGLGSRVRDGRLGVRLATRSAPLAGLAFMAMSGFMYAIGWQVGAPRASERATMLVVLAVSAAAAALVAGASLGHSLAAAAPSLPQHQPGGLAESRSSG